MLFIEIKRNILVKLNIKAKNMSRYLKDLFERTNIWFNSLTDEEWRDFNYFIAVTCGILIIMTWIRAQI
jgi:acetone carboxylase gamma subunit|tara:strand:- start:1877 stop:2083 length:207 start_codon:yes stop_codon:yes gene_type:complete